MMSLYFAPLACSLATRIALYEAGAHVEYIQVDTRSKRLRDGSDFYPISPLGQVPVLRTEEGWLLSENTAISAVRGRSLPGHAAGAARRYVAARQIAAMAWFYRHGTA
ncbi:hypothetical protein P3T40_001675 [Paraburkholderia sp. EB58]|jgi:glutathione S-transferase